MDGTSRREPELLLSTEEQISELTSASDRDLVATIHQSLIPKLLIAHHATSTDIPAQSSDARLPPSDAEIAAFAHIAVTQDLKRSLAYIHDLVREGMSVETVLLRLLAPSARWLGEEWLAERQSFTEVSVALVTIQQIVRILGPSSDPADAVMLTSPSGELLS